MTKEILTFISILLLSASIIFNAIRIIDLEESVHELKMHHFSGGCHNE